MTNLNTIRSKVLPLIQPTEEENKALDQLFRILKEKLHYFANKLNILPTFIQNHGSTGIKQTHLRGTSDLDIFIGLDPAAYTNIINLPPKMRKNTLKDLFLSYVNEWFIPAAQAAGFPRYQLSYAEHPYLIITHEKYEIDIVGCFDLPYDFLLTNGPITAVDRTPWHSKIIAEKLSDAQKQDVRLLKAFFQANYVYGDKNTLGRFGFTGFSAEILILYYQNIENVFSHFEELQHTAIDFFDRSPTFLRKIKRFQNDFLLIIDPVDKNRNLAASISKRAYEYALFQIKQFQTNPSPKFFLKEPLQPLTSNKLSPFSPHLVVIEFKSDGTVHYSELRDKLTSACERLRKLLEKEKTGEPRFGKTFFEVYFEGNIYAAIFYCEYAALDSTYLRRGPPKTKIPNVKQFCAKHPNAFLKNGFYYAPIEREFRKPIDLVSHFFQNYKKIKGLTLHSITHEGATLIGQRAVTLMITHILPLYGVIPL
ncbi:MAG: hypothetical protein ACTSYB_02365 [Candidatus Helarchaeota archaeon]